MIASALGMLPLVLLLLLALPAAVQAQFSYVTNNGSITITGYDCPTNPVALVIPETITGLPVTSIGGGFTGCPNLTSVTIPDSVTSIGDSAFYGSGQTDPSSGLTALAVNDSIMITGYNCLSNAVVIPDSISGLPVTSIGDGAFQDCLSLTNVTIPSSVTSIGAAAFRSCTSLTSVVIPNSVTSIGPRAFYDCSSLTSVVIPNSVTNIGDVLFLGSGNRYTPSGLRALAVNGTMTITGYYGSSDDVVIPGTIAGLPVTTIGLGALSDLNLTSVTIPNSVTNIGDYAFTDCTSLTNLTIGNSVTSIGAIAFSGCPLTSVYFRGNSPSVDPTAFDEYNETTVYHLPGTTGWGTNFAGLPTALWSLPNPLVLTTGPAFGIRTNQFGFTISWATNLSVVVEASTDLDHPAWAPVATNTLSGGSSFFSDPQWTNSPARFYRMRSQ